MKELVVGVDLQLDEVRGLDGLLQLTEVDAFRHDEVGYLGSQFRSVVVENANPRVVDSIGIRTAVPKNERPPQAGGTFHRLEDGYIFLLARIESDDRALASSGMWNVEKSAEKSRYKIEISPQKG